MSAGLVSPKAECSHGLVSVHTRPWSLLSPPKDASHVGSGPTLFKFNVIVTNYFCKALFPHKVTLLSHGDWNFDIFLVGAGHNSTSDTP